MPDKRTPSPMPPPELSFEEKAMAAWVRASESWKRSQGTWLTAATIVACALAAWSVWSWKQRDSREVAHRLYGRAMVFRDNGRPDSAKAILEKVVEGYSGIEASKAALQLGHDLFEQRDWAGSLAKYQRAREDGSGYPLLEGGARRGIAACYIEQGKYAQAESELEGILSSYQKLTGDAADRAKETEPQDLVPSLYQVMWQLVLVREKLSRSADAVQVAQALVKLYPGSPESDQAKIWLALNGKAPQPI
ncbi:MAG TPA: tetratricopeptide repeat protein [Fibrobacteria bacterium]|nr:tetratricopeptide repeat protein [Fibrobacteria bacterium]